MKRNVLWLIVFGVFLLLLVAGGAAFVGFRAWHFQTLPIYQFVDPDPSGNPPVAGLKSGDLFYVSNEAEFFLEPADYGSLRTIGRTAEGLTVSAIAGQDPRDFVVLSGFMFPHVIYRNHERSPIGLENFSVDEIRLLANEGFNPQRADSRDRAMIDEVLETLKNPVEVPGDQQETKTYHILLLSDALPGLGHFVYVVVDAEERVYLSGKMMVDTWIPVGPQFSRWVLDSR